MSKSLVRVLVSLLVIFAAIGVFLKFGQSAYSEKKPTSTARRGSPEPISSEALSVTLSPTVSEIAASQPDPGPQRFQRPLTKREYREEQGMKQEGKPISPLTPDEEENRGTNPVNTKKIRRIDENVVPSMDEAVYVGPDGLRPDAPLINSPIANFEGQSIEDTIAVGQGFLPPDTVGDVGPNHYVQAVNSTFRVFNKSGGAVTPVATLGSLWGTIPGACANKSDGDPTVNYDSLADRWVITQFCVSVANPNNHQLIAISQTPNPAGAYYLYDFMMPNNKFNDYPKFGIWPNGYYMSDNQFNQAGTAFQGAGVFAFDRAKMLAGDPTASFIYFDLATLDATIAGILPSDADGLTPPPANAPNVFAYFTATEFGDASGDGLRLFDFNANFAVPASSTFTERAGSPLAVAAFNPLETASGDTIEQPPPGTAASNLNAISDRLMNRLQYRNFGTHTSLIVNHTVNVGTGTTTAALHQAGVRYYELRSTGGAYSVNEQASYAPDTDNRWMGSAAMDRQGNLAVGYSVSSLTTFPSIRYAGRLAGDPANSLAQGEASLVAGAFSQANGASRWGDYSQLNLDPTDDCTFWYTQEYFSVDNPATNAEWKTRIGSFKVNNACTAPSQGTLAINATNCAAPFGNVQGASITIANNLYTSTQANGTAATQLPPGTYIVTISHPSYAAVTIPNVVIINGNTTTVNQCLSGTPTPVAVTTVITAESCAPMDNALSPGETVTVNFGLKNAGTAATTNLVGTLQATGGVVTPSGPQNYGTLPPDNTTVVSRPFSFTVDPSAACGSIVTASIQLQDGAINLGVVTFTLQVGAPGAPATATYSSGNIAVPIPDTGSVEIPISVPDLGSINDVNVSFRANHTFDGDLVVSLVHPDGTVRALSNNRGGAGQNYGTGANSCAGTPTVFDDEAAATIGSGVAPFAGSFRPDATLAFFDGKASSGTWKLRVSDTAALDVGTVGCVTLTVTRSQFVCCGVAGIPIISSGGAAVLTAENFTPPNSAPDPGETVTVNLPVVNTGTSATTSLVGTLQATGGVTAPSGPQNYGAVLPTGPPPTTRPFTFTVNPAAACGSTITLTLALQDGATNFGTATYTMTLGSASVVTSSFTNAAAIAVPGTGTSGPAAPYPSSINVAGVTGNVTKVTVTLNQMAHSFPDDMDILLVGPGGQKILVASDFGGDTDFTAGNNTYTLDDAGAAPLADGALNPNGTYRPTNYGAGDTFVTTAPVGPYPDPQQLSAFNGVNPNGTWSLYVVDDVGGDAGGIAGGWSISISASTTTCTPPPVVVTATTTTVNSSANPVVAGQPVTITATVAPVPSGGTVTFIEGGTCAAPGTVLSGPTAVSGGQATYNASGLSVGTHVVRACYSGNASFSASSGIITQVMLNPIFTYNASANASVNQYTLIVNGPNYEIRNTLTGAVLASQPVAGTTQIIVNGENGDFDILTVNFSGGPIIPINGIQYNGGTGGPDSMNTLGGTFSDCISAPSNANNGTLECLGGPSIGSRIVYTGLEPINDANVVANYTINGTAGANNIAVINGPGGTVQVNSGVPATFELINFTNKTNVIIDSLAGADVTTVNFSVVPNALSSIRINTGNEIDNTNILSLPTTVTLNIDGQGGIDDTVIGNSLALVNQQDGSLLNINGTINVRSNSLMNLSIDDSGNLLNQTYTTSSLAAVPVFGGAGQKVDRPSSPSDINSTANVDLVLFYGGKGSDTFNFNSTGFAFDSLVNGNAGNDVFNINGNGLTGLGGIYNGGPGNDTFNVSPQANGGTADIVINGDDPTTLPGDSVSIVGGPYANGVLAIGANGFGTFTSSTHKTIFFTGIEVQAPTTTTIAATAATTYGANATFTATVATQMPGTGSPTGTVSFLADGVAIAGCTTVAVTAVPTTTATASCTTNTLAAGVRAISAVYNPTGYYTTSTGTSNHTVNKAVLTVTADNQARAYGAANPTLTATITGFVLSQNLGTSGVTGTPTLATTATPTSPVGAYPITATIGTLAAANYSFTFVNGTLTVNKAVITVTGDNKSRVFGAPNPALTVTYTGFVNGETFANSGITGAPGISTTATQSSPVGSYPITVTNGTLAASNYSFTLVNGTLTITQAATTTTITNAGSLGNPTVGVPYAVNFTVAPVAPSTGTPTGTVTVSDGTGATCTASVAAGTCNLTSTTPGPKTITATYPGDTNFTGSSSLTIPVNVFIAMTGNVKQHVAFGTNTNLAGVTLTLTNTTSNSVVGQTTSDASGNYSFGVLTAGGSYRITPSGLGKTYEAENRSYTNVVGNLAGADFVAYDVPGPNANPRGARVTNQTTTPGQSVTVPIVMAKVGNEARIAFSIDYAAGVLGVPTITCGTGEPGCTVVVNNSLAGRAGVTITPAGGTFNAGVTEIARVTFPTFATTLTSTPIRFGDFPTARDVRNADNNPLPTLYWTDGTVSFTSSTVLDGATVSGRVLTSNGQGVRNATVTITDSTGSRRTATTSSFGTYTFEGLQVGTTYAIAVSSKRYRFQTRVVNITESLTDINFTGQE